MVNVRIFLTALLILILAQSAQAGDWPMFRHDAAHSGVADETIELPLEVLWKFEAESSINFPPAVSGGVVYMGSQDNNVYALDASTGSLKWKFQTDSSIMSSPAVSGGVVYIGSGEEEGYVYALDASTGSLKWKYKTQDVEGFGSSLNSPTVSGGVVYISSWNGYVSALDASTGSLKWEYQAGRSVSSSPAVSGGVVYIGSGDDNVYALDASTGSLKWKFQTGDYIRDSSPAVSGGVVYIGSQDNNVYALDASTGSLKWKFQTDSSIMSSPAVSGGVVYIGSQDNYVYAIEASTGSLKWEYKTGDAVYASPAISGGVVYVGSTDHYVYALDASSGSLKWKSEYVWYPSSSAVSGGVLYVPQLSGILYAFAPAQPLAISISSPSRGQSFTTSTITISGTASDDIGLNKVEIRVNAGSWQLASGTTSWSKQVTLSSGENTIYARATVTSGNTAETSVTVSYNPPPHPSTGSVSVSSSPSGASVYLDGSYQGTTPKTITSIEEGSHTITLKLTDYEDGSQPINVVAGQTIGVSQDLAKSPTPTSTIIADNTLFNPYVLSAITSALIIAIATIIGAWINSRRRS